MSLLWEKNHQHCTRNSVGLPEQARGEAARPWIVNINLVSQRGRQQSLVIMAAIILSFSIFMIHNQMTVIFTVTEGGG